MAERYDEPIVLFFHTQHSTRWGLCPQTPGVYRIEPVVEEHPPESKEPRGNRSCHGAGADYSPTGTLTAQVALPQSLILSMSPPHSHLFIVCQAPLRNIPVLIARKLSCFARPATGKPASGFKAILDSSEAGRETRVGGGSVVEPSNFAKATLDKSVHYTATQ